VTATPPLDWRRVLAGENEAVMCHVLRVHGPIMARDEFEQWCSERGLKVTSFFMMLRYSPIITKYAVGVYGLRGSVIQPGIVEALRSKHKPAPVLVDFGWISEGRIWLGLKLSAPIIKSGVFGIPAPMRQYLQGDFALKASDDTSIGNLRIRESTGWSLGSFFRRRGGEPDDYLLLTFDPRSREAIAYLGGEDLLDDFRPEP
jgi:hypothetical protein